MHISATVTRTGIYFKSIQMYWNQCPMPLKNYIQKKRLTSDFMDKIPLNIVDNVIARGNRGNDKYNFSPFCTILPIYYDFLPFSTAFSIFSYDFLPFFTDFHHFLRFFTIFLPFFQIWQYAHSPCVINAMYKMNDLPQTHGRLHSMWFLPVFRLNAVSRHMPGQISVIVYTWNMLTSIEEKCPANTCSPRNNADYFKLI